MFMIGIDPHKGSHTAVVVDRTEAVLVTIMAPKRGSKRARRASRMGAGRAGSMKTPGGSGVGGGGMGVGGSGVEVGVGAGVDCGKKVTAGGGAGDGIAVGVEAQAASRTVMKRPAARLDFRGWVTTSF